MSAIKVYERRGKKKKEVGDATEKENVQTSPESYLAPKTPVPPAEVKRHQKAGFFDSPSPVEETEANSQEHVNVCKRSCKRVLWWDEKLEETCSTDSTNSEVVDKDAQLATEPLSSPCVVLSLSHRQVQSPLISASPYDDHLNEEKPKQELPPPLTPSPKKRLRNSVEGQSRIRRVRAKLTFEDFYSSSPRRRQGKRNVRKAPPRRKKSNSIKAVRKAAPPRKKWIITEITRGMRSMRRNPSIINGVDSQYNSLWGYKTEIEASHCLIYSREGNFPFKDRKKRMERRPRMHNIWGCMLNFSFKDKKKSMDRKNRKKRMEKVGNGSNEKAGHEDKGMQFASESKHENVGMQFASKSAHENEGMQFASESTLPPYQDIRFTPIFRREDIQFTSTFLPYQRPQDIQFTSTSGSHGYETIQFTSTLLPYRRPEDIQFPSTSNSHGHGHENIHFTSTLLPYQLPDDIPCTSTFSSRGHGNENIQFTSTFLPYQRPDDIPFTSTSSSHGHGHENIQFTPTFLPCHQPQDIQFTSTFSSRGHGHENIQFTPGFIALQEVLREGNITSKDQSAIIDEGNITNNKSVAKRRPKVKLPKKPRIPSINSIVLKLKSLKISDRRKNSKKMVNTGALVCYNGIGTGALLPYQVQDSKSKKPKKALPMVNLDLNSTRMWEIVMKIDNGKGQRKEDDQERAEWWENERKVFRGRIDNFTLMMHHFLGDRRFKPWRGSVVDSVVGVFLTQNVSDNLSSNAFMSLVAKYPNNGDEVLEIMDSGVPMESNSPFNESTHNIHGSQYYVTEPEADMDHDLEEFGLVATPEQPKGKVQVDASTDVPIVRADDMTLKLEPIHNPSNMEEEVVVKTIATPFGKKKKVKEKNAAMTDWNSLKETYSRPRTRDQTDAVNWEAVRSAKLSEIALTIKSRGQHTILAARIQEFLNRVVELHGSIDLEWLRYAPQDLVKEYLLEIYGVGLKSTECIRLLALQHMAFPVDVNVGRIAVRLGWVPLKPLPGNLEFHLLEAYPLMDDIQKYLWPRLHTLDQETLYELHYHMITFGKIFCTKIKPNCNACPMRTRCKFFASAEHSSKKCLPKASDNDEATVPSMLSKNCIATEENVENGVALESNLLSESYTEIQNCQPLVEEPKTPPYEEPKTPLCEDIEDFGDDEEIPYINLSQSQGSHEGSHDLIPVIASTKIRKLKHIERLRTEHQVYEIPDGHELLRGFDRRDPDETLPYLFAIWKPGEMPDSYEEPMRRCNSQGPELCNDKTCSSCESIREGNEDILRGTILIPCRTAMKGKFPLNGTYFQVNEVFADHESSYNPILVPRSTIWNLPMRTLFVGSSTTSIFKDGLTLGEIQENFWRGYVCVRGMNRRTREPKAIPKRFHCPPSKMARKTTEKTKSHEQTVQAQQ